MENNNADYTADGLDRRFATLAMAYPPPQTWRDLYDADVALERGTIFRELDMPFEAVPQGRTRTARSDSGDEATAMRRVQICMFALNEAALYLDGHPNDPLALAYFNKYSLLAGKARSEYEAAYGPVRFYYGNAASGDAWKWIERKWPWQL